jgi:hypothetical protein
MTYKGNIVYNVPLQIGPLVSVCVLVGGSYLELVGLICGNLQFRANMPPFDVSYYPYG